MAERREPLRLYKDANDQICNLCLLPAALTDDHVPTKGWGNDSLIEVRRFLGEQFKAKQAILKCQGGVFFKTLCRQCNGEVLGGIPDAGLAELVAVCRKQFGREKRTFEAVLRPNAILRSILGHMISLRNYTERDMTLDVMIRNYLIHGKPLDARIKVYVWPFIIPDRLVIARDFVFADLKSREVSGILNVIKFDPLAVVVQLDGSDFSAPSFHEFATAGANEEFRLALQFSTVFDPDFPEQAQTVDPKYVVVAGKGFTDGIERVV